MSVFWKFAEQACEGVQQAAGPSLPPPLSELLVHCLLMQETTCPKLFVIYPPQVHILLSPRLQKPTYVASSGCSSFILIFATQAVTSNSFSEWKSMKPPFISWGLKLY